VSAGHIDWYAARAAGVVAYVLLTGVVLLGLTVSGRARLPRWPAFALTDVHRFGSLLVGVFLGVHVLAISLDSYTPFSVAQLVVPGASSYRPLWVALGIVSAELLLAIAVTNLLRRKIPYRWWKRAHMLNLVVWAGSAVHLLGAGTDSGAAWLRTLAVASIAAVLGAIVWRVVQRRLPRLSTVGAVAATSLAGFTLVAGLGLLPHSLGTNGTAAAATKRPQPPTRLSVAFSGSIAQRQGAGGALVSVVGHGSGNRKVLVRIDLVTPDGSTITDTSLQLEDVSSGAVCAGTVAAIDATGFNGTCSFPGGAAHSVTGSWQVRDGSVSGRVLLAA